ncbi:MAG TPA: C40 family peptidase [Frankiaceae bacterium]|nr:C40 family peptidase [Frankiaceae bacterium]
MRTARSFRHALARPVRGLVAASVLASGLALAAPAAPAAATDPIGTRLAITPYRQDKLVGERAAFTVTLTGADGRVLTGRPVTFWTRSVSTSTWSKYVTRNTDTYGRTALAFYVRSSTYVRATWPGDTKYAPTGTVTAGVVAYTSIGPRVVTEASRHAGKPYQWGAVGPDRFDCSGYTLYVYARFGKKLPHNSQQQYNSIRHVSKSEMRVGDLIFTGSSPSSIGHVAIYAGNGEMWHSPHSGSVVKKVRIYTSTYWVGRVA